MKKKNFSIFYDFFLIQTISPVLFLLYLQLDKNSKQNVLFQGGLYFTRTNLILRKRFLDLHCPMVHKNVFPHKFILLRKTFRGTVIHSTITILHMFVQFNFRPK